MALAPFFNDMRIRLPRLSAAGIRGDVRLAVRTLARSPGFTIATLASLSAGFAVAICALAIANAYQARSFPFPNVGRLYHLMYAPPGPVEPRGMSGIDWSTASDVVEHAVTTSGQTFYLSADDGARSARGLEVSPGFIQALGVRAALGRTFVPADFQDQNAPVAMIGHELWRDHFGGDPSVVGRVVRVDVEGQTEPELLQIVGVLRPSFWFGRSSADSVGIMTLLRRPATTYMVALREGVSVEHAQRRLTSIAAGTATWLPAQWPGVRLEAMHDRYVEPLRPMLRAIIIAAVLVVLLTCVSVAVLVVLRTTRRSRDVAVRVAHGASRAHLLRLFGAETGVLAIAAIVLGTALTATSLRVIAPSIETHLGKPSAGGPSAIAIDGGVALAMTVVVALVAVSLGLIPALIPWQRRLAPTLRGDARAGADNQWTRRARAWLIGVEIAGSVALLVGCGIMIRTAVSIQTTNLGTDFGSVLRARVVLRGSRYPDAAAYERFHVDLKERLAAHGLNAAFSGWPPFIDHPLHTVEGGATPRAITSGMVSVGAGYFETVGIALRQGRAFDATDRSTSEPVAIISESLARTLWPTGGAIGGRIRYVESRPSSAPEIPWRRVVGVAADARQTYQDQTMLDLYVPTLQADPERFISTLIRTNLGPAAATRIVRSTVATLDPTAVTGLARVVATENVELARVRFMRAMLAGFATLTALLAALGVYGVVAHSVRQRERELAIRVAIGASPRSIVALFLRESAGLLAAGIAVGAVASVGIARVLETRAFSAVALDPLTVVAAAAFMAAIGFLATLEPVLRAARRNPAAALHS
jgi:putative ABC transport system permease protein